MNEMNQTVSINPATGEVLGHTKLHQPEDLIEAVKRARAAQVGWAATPVYERARLIRRVRDLMAERADEIAETIARDNGKTRVDALATEVLAGAMAANWYANHAERLLRDRPTTGGNLLLVNKSSKIVRVPFGVVGIISPWNYPFAIPFHEVVMGLLAGNAVILKTASETQLAGRVIEELILDAGVPKDVFTFINLPGRIAGDLFLESGIDKLFFTGSVPIGKKLMAKAAETLTPVSLELGGNDAMLVCADADLDRAAAGALWAGMQNAGQSCGGVERIYVHKDVYDRFMELLGAKVRALRVGVETEHDVDMGAITTKRQLDTIKHHVKEAVEKGAVIFAQSNCPTDTAGFFHPAMVLTNVDHTMIVMREETFGPVVGVMKVETMDEAVELANDSNLGLTGSVWSRNTGEAEKLARRIRAGAITINDHLMSHGLAETPWGGFNESGIGRTHGDLGFDEMTEPQVIVHDWLPGVKKNFWWHPHGPDIYDGLRGALDLLYGKGAGRKLAGMSKLLKVFPRTFQK